MDIDKVEFKKMLDEADREVARLKALGWTQQDFARALRNLLDARRNR